MVSQKCQYAIRAVFELAKRHGQGPVKINDIAEAQAIPPRFLEIILNQLRRVGFVESRRGAEGGYLLARSPNDLTVGDVVRFVEGPIVPVACMTDKAGVECPLHGSCVFMAMWERVAKAMVGVYDTTTFQDLVDQEAKMVSSTALSYTI